MIDMNSVTSHKYKAKEKAERVTITLQRNLLKKVDTMREDVPRSPFVQIVLQKYLKSGGLERRND